MVATFARFIFRPIPGAIALKEARSTSIRPYPDFS
jgi:hypothetical protein